MKKFFYFIFSCATISSVGVTYAVLLVSYITIPGFAPLGFLTQKNINKMKKFFYFIFSCATISSVGVTYAVLLVSYITIPGFAPLGFLTFFLLV